MVAAGWPLLVEDTRREAVAYLAVAGDAAIWERRTRCAPWTVRDVTRHLAATFQRFADMLDQSRCGDLSPPFARNHLDAENLRAVKEFEGHPEARFEAELERFLGAVGQGSELMAHQRGPIPVSLQVLFGLADIVLHHDDIAAASGGSYRPRPVVVDALVPVWHELGIALGSGDPWEALTRWRAEAE